LTHWPWWLTTVAHFVPIAGMVKLGLLLTRAVNAGKLAQGDDW
jgi:hypothetical protein